MTEDPKELVARLRDLMAKATLLPWKERPSHYREIQGSPARGEKYGDMVTTFTGAVAKQQGYGKDNVRFIVEAVNALPTLLDALDRLTADRERSVGEWQPISTAPEDGTPFDAWVPDAFGGRRMTGLSFNRKGQLRQHGLLTAAELPRWPTHWMPLPAAPAPALPKTGVEE